MRELTMPEMHSIFGGEGGGSAGSSGGTSGDSRGGGSNNGGGSSSSFDNARFGTQGLTAATIVAWYQKTHPPTALQFIYQNLSAEVVVQEALKALNDPTVSTRDIANYFGEAAAAAKSNSGGGNHHN